MDNQKVSDPKDFQVVEFFNSTDFDFTPELGAMYDGRPLFVGSGQRKQFPYHIGHRLAVNLAKAVLIKGAPLHDPTANNPVGTPLWGDQKVKDLEASFVTELYTDEKPLAMTETDRLMQRVAELEKLFQKQEAEKPLDAPRPQVKSIQELVAPELNVSTAPKEASVATEVPKTYQDKQEVILELERRNIAHDKRSSKDSLLKLLG